MSKVRIYEVAKELGMEQKALVALFQSMGFGEVRNHMSSVEPELVERVRRHIEKQKSSAIVEERIRPTVVKRRAVARPDSPTRSETPAMEIPASRPSARTPSVSQTSVSEPPAQAPEPIVARSSSTAAARVSAPEPVESEPPAPVPSVPVRRPSSTEVPSLEARSPLPAVAVPPPPPAEPSPRPTDD